MSMLRVTCVTRDESNPDRLIGAIGGEGFHHTIDEAIGYIAGGTHQYFAQVEDDSVWLEVAHHPNGTSFLKTELDSFPPTTLLSLEECQPLEEDDSSAGTEGVDALEAMGNDERPGPGQLAEQLAMKTIVRLLLVDHFGRKQGRIDTMRDRAMGRLSEAVDRLDVDEDVRKQLQDALNRQINFFFAPPPEA